MSKPPAYPVSAVIPDDERLNALAADRIDALIAWPEARCMCGSRESCEWCSSFSAFNQLRDKLRHLSAELRGKPITPPTLEDYGATISIPLKDLL